MGEYATRLRDGANVKIGTCESMYYLRADQRHLVRHRSGNVNPNGKDALSIRFRFPWPDEDENEPGDFEDYDRAIAVSGMSAPPSTEVDHYTVQFRADAGYLLSLPCPESGDNAKELVIHRNGFSGAVKLVQQKLLADGRLVPVCMCGGCGARWRIEDPAEIERLALAFRTMGDNRTMMSRDRDPAEGAFYHTIADRILAGAKIENESTANVEG